MAKRRSLNRKWSRRSTNSAFLNDDSRMVEDDPDYWQYLNITPRPSALDMTSASTVLNPDSNLVDSKMSDSQWAYLQKSTDNISTRDLRNTSKSSKQNVSMDEPSSGSESLKTRKKRPLLRNTRNVRAKNAILINSSDSTVEMNDPRSENSRSTDHSPSRIPTRPATPQDTSFDSEIITKKRPLLKRQTPVTPDSSLVLPSQETRTTSIRSRSTLLHKSKTTVESRNDRQESTSEGDSPLISQPRKIFGQMRKFKVTHNPFEGILDETEEHNETDPSFVKDITKNQSNDTGDLVLQITPDDSKRPSRQRRDDEESTSSISEELKVTEKNRSFEKIIERSRMRSRQSDKSKQTDIEGDLDDHQSFTKSNVSKSSMVIRSRDDKTDSRVTRSGISSVNVSGVNNTEQMISMDGQERNSRTSKVSRASESNKSSVHSNLVTVDSDEQERGLDEEEHGDVSPRSKVPDQNRSQSSVSRPSRSEEYVNKNDRSEDHTKTNERNIGRKSRITVSSADAEDDFVAMPRDLDQSMSSRQSHVAKSIEQRTNADVQLAVSDDESLFVPRKSEASASTVPSSAEQTVNSAQNGRTSKTAQMNVSVSSVTSKSENFVRPGPRSSKLSMQLSESPNKSSIGAEALNKSLDSTMDKSLSQPSTSQSVVNQSRKSEDSEFSDSDEIQRRPGPKSFKRSSRSVLSISKISNTSKLSGGPEVSQKPELFGTSKAYQEPEVARNPENFRKSEILQGSQVLQKPETPQKPKIVRKSHVPQESEIPQTPGPAQKSQVLQKPETPQKPKIVRKSHVPQESEIPQTPGPAQKSQVPQEPGVPKKPKALQEPEPLEDETDSLSESSSRVNTRESEPLQYALPSQERSSSVSLSESSHEIRVTNVPVDLNNSSISITLPDAHETSQMVIESRRREVEKKEDNEPPAKTFKTRPRPSAILSQIRSSKSPCHAKETQISVEIEPVPSTSSAIPDKRLSKVDATTETAEQKKKLRQLKIDALMKRGKTQVSQTTQESTEPFNVEDFKKKLVEAKKILDKRKATEEQAELKRAENRKKKVSTSAGKIRPGVKSFKGLKKPEKPAKVVDKAFIVNGKVYKRPKLPRPKHWATNKLYKFLWKKMEPKFGQRYRVKSEKFILELSELVTVITRRKKYENYRGDLEDLMRKMAKLGIIETRHDFYGFCYDFLPYEFRFKVIPMLQPGNIHNIPYEPDRLYTPILGKY